MRNFGLLLFLAVFTFACTLALALVKVVNFWFLILIIESILIAAIVSLLSCGVPKEIVKTAEHNCYRINGVKSTRRERRERKAKASFRLDLIAVLLLVALSGNLLIWLIDSFFIPLPLISESLSLFSVNLDSWRDRMGDRNLDRDFLLWQGFGQSGNTEMQQQPHFVKSSLPAVLCLATLWAAGCLLFLRFAYSISLQKYCLGIRSRCNEYLNMDIGRLQE